VTDVATAPAANPMAGFTVHRTSRDTWHVVNRINGDHFEANNAAEVTNAVELYKANAIKREQARLAAEEAARNPQLAEFGTTIPGESLAFDSFVPVSAAGKANAPAAFTEAPGAVPEPEEVVPLSPAIKAQMDAYVADLLAKANAQGAEPEPDSTAKVGVEPPATAGVERTN
jgi:hypothetical protein